MSEIKVIFLNNDNQTAFSDFSDNSTTLANSIKLGSCNACWFKSIKRLLKKLSINVEASKIDLN